jgi:phospholipid/cholesterol/gamma-HCH transport system substrate-binding protein
LETRLGVFMALAMIAGFIIIEILGGRNFFTPGYHLKAEFNNLQDVKVGDVVKMAGYPIGRVEKMRLGTNKVEVTLKLNKDAPVHTDSIATIKPQGLLGQSFISIDFGTPGAPRLEDGQLIASAEQPDISAILAKLDDVATGVQNLTRTFSGDKIDNILGPLVSFMKENNPRLTAILANIQAISTQIKDGQGTVGKLIYDDSLYATAQQTLTNVQDALSEVKLTVADAHKAVNQINSGEGTIGKLVKDDALYRETTATMTNLKEITAKLNSGEGTIGKLVNDQEFYRNAKLTLQKIDKATESLEDAGPLSLIGQLVTTLF